MSKSAESQKERHISLQNDKKIINNLLYKISVFVCYFEDG